MSRSTTRLRFLRVLSARRRGDGKDPLGIDPLPRTAAVRRFVSVTYGADGSTRERTHNVVSRVQKETQLNCVPHLTCIGASRGEVLDIARKYWDQGIRHIVALRGDRAGRHREVRTARRRLRVCARTSCRGSRSVGDFEISVAAYPEKHPEAPSAEFDLDNPQAQDRRGRDARHHAVLLRHRTVPALPRRLRRARASTRRIVPGILPITRFPQVTRFAKRCGASIPDWLEHRFDGLEENPETRKLISAAVAIEQVHMLQRHGVDQFHFYTLNRSELTYAICHALGVRPQALDRKAANE